MARSNSSVVAIRSREATLKRKIRRHLNRLGLKKGPDGNLYAQGDGKEAIRALHGHQRAEKLRSNKDFIHNNLDRYLPCFAAGDDIDPARITPKLERVLSNSWQAELFRLASLTWSVPVSRGFGRRLRYLVWDRYNDRLIGLIAIGDPVFNLAVRDNHIGWNTSDRTERLTNIMDAYVVGALPPYNMLLGGKLVACLIRSRDIYDDFAKAYGQQTGIISEKKKKPRLLAVTTSSSMGRSSVYNRLKLDGVPYLAPLGYTGGWGHFHIPDSLFEDLRQYLRAIGHPYADHHAYGQGPNWRFRTMRAAFSSLGIGDDLLRHGIRREVFISFLADNGAHILGTGKGRPDLSSLRSVEDIGQLALNRWIKPRASRRTEFRSWRADYVRALFSHPPEGTEDILNHKGQRVGR